MKWYIYHYQINIFPQYIISMDKANKSSNPLINDMGVKIDFIKINTRQFYTKYFSINYVLEKNNKLY